MHTLYTVHCYAIYTVTIQARREELDLEANVCAKSATSLQILPHLTKVSSILSHLSKAYWVNIIRWCMFNIMFINHAFSSWSPKLSTCVPSSRERLPLAVNTFHLCYQFHLFPSNTSDPRLRGILTRRSLTQSQGSCRGGKIFWLLRWKHFPGNIWLSHHV